MLESKKSAVALELHARRIKFYWTNLDDLAMKVLEVDLRPIGDTIKDGPQGGTTFSDLISVISRSPMRVGSFYQLQVGQHAQSRREDIGRDVFWRRKQLRIRERSMHQKIANYQKGPLITEHVQCRTDRTHGPPINPVHIIGHILAPGCHLLNEKFSNIALNRTMNRGRERFLPSPPSEPGVQFSRDGLSSQLFPHRDWRANLWAFDIVNSPRPAKKAFGHCL